VADPVVVLVAPAAGGAALRDRLSSLGFRCERIDSSGPLRGWRAADGDLVVVLEAGGCSSALSMVLSRRGGTRLDGLPTVVIGSLAAASSAEAEQVDEVIAEPVSDAVLRERLMVWGKWGLRARRLADLDIQIRDSVRIDALTGLPGHRAFHERLEMEVKRSERYGSPLGMILADVAGLNSINARYGHRTGDHVLKEVAETLRRSIRDVDYAARYDGDSFALLLPEAVPETALKVISRLRVLSANLIFRSEGTGGSAAPLFRISLHFGMAGLPDDRLRGKDALIGAVEADLQRERSVQIPPPIAV
jgi:diguanylate cyclase (GGDEF)-like protein